MKGEQERRCQESSAARLEEDNFNKCKWLLFVYIELL